MQEFATSHSPVLLALLAGLFTWACTAAGSSVVLFFKTIRQKVLDVFLGASAGIMLAASYWSLLAPALALGEASSLPAWAPATIGFLIGGAFLWVLDQVVPHLHPGMPEETTEGIRTHWDRSILLVVAVTLHNVPEGLALGVAYGALAGGHGSVGGALALALGLGLQNVPEGGAVSLPLRRVGLSRWRAFNYGQLSGFVEPVAAVAGAAAVEHVSAVLPYALAFAAGAMIYVVIEELVPEAQRTGDTDWPTIGAMLGFALMMVLDVALS